jgi:uncharacterized protein YdhG (YjbR/CyaY superfamily)
MAERFATIDEYIAAFPADVQEILEEIRRRMLRVVPAAGQKISYQMPTMTLQGRSLVHFGAWKKHIAVYPMPADESLLAELAPYLAGRSTARFPLSEPVPYDLIERLVRQLADQRAQ